MVSNMKQAFSMSAFFKEYQMQAFEPLAYYDKHMDCIRVIVRDCSITEHRINEMFTLMEDNHPTQGQHRYVGFTIKGIRHLFDQLNLPLDGVLRVSDILQKIVRENPDRTVALITDVIWVDPYEK